jgi:hypothetical protein
MAAEGRRLALVIATSHFADRTLEQLVTPGQDAADLARVLSDCAIGGFEIKLLIDRPSHEVRREIEAFFAARQREDFLVIYFSTHGIKDDDGRLYLASTDTDRSLLRATTVPAGFVNEVMNSCRSRRQVLILDCCQSGAFARGMVAKGGDAVGIRDNFEGRGRVVLTASSATQYAFQGQDVVGTATQSVFTRHLVRGLESGEADEDGDGWISLDELYDYVFARVRDETPQQTPGKYEFETEGELLIARSRLGRRERPADDPELFRRHANALAALNAGRWQDSLHTLDSIEAERPDYPDVAERARPLRELAAALKPLGPAPRGWRRAVFRLPILAVLLATTLPNLLNSNFNFAYNGQAVINPLTQDGLANAKHVFWWSAAIVNGAAFPVGLGLLAFLGWPVQRGLTHLRTTQGVATDDLERLRGRCLNLGHNAALTSMCLWAIAGPPYPIAIYWFVGKLSLGGWTYFIISLVMNGLFAAALAFFCVTVLSVRVLYPPLVQPGSTTAQDAVGLARLSVLAWTYLKLAVAVPLLAIALVLIDVIVKLQSKSNLAELQSTLVWLVVGVLGALAGLVLAVKLFGTIQGDLEVLRQAVARSQPRVRVAESTSPAAVARPNDRA